MGLRNLLRRRTRTLLTLVGIAISIAAVVALGAFADGFSNSFSAGLNSSGADIVVVEGDALDALSSVIDSGVQARLTRLPGISQVSAGLVAFMSLPDAPYFPVFGLDPKEFGIGRYQIVAGRMFNAPRQMLLGRSAAGAYHKQVGDYFKLRDVSLKVVGLYETGQGMEDSGAVIGLADAQEIFRRPGQVSYYQIKLADPGLTERVIADVEQHFPDLIASRSTNYADNLRQTQMMRAIGFGVMVLAALAGGLGMMNTMLMSVLERTREIGMLRAVGWRRRRVLVMILGEAMMLCLLGGVLGCALAAAAIAAINRGPILSGFLDGTLTLARFGQAMLTALALGALGGLYPAWRATQLTPLAAMRYDGATAGASTTAEAAAWRWLEAAALLTGTLSALALRNLRRQRSRTLITGLAIGVSIGLVTAIGGMTAGVTREFSAMGEQRGELSITETRASDISGASVDGLVGRFAGSLPGVKYVSGMLLGVADLAGTESFMIFGLEPGSFWIRQFAITEGERLQTSREILLGKAAARNLNKRVGDTISIRGVSYRVAGVYETGIGYQDCGGVLTLDETQRLLKRPNQVSIYGLKLSDGSYARAIQRQIEQRFPEVTVSRSTDAAESANLLLLVNAATGGLSLIAVLIGVVSLTNTMLMSVLERTREIGILRALGWRRRQVVGLVLRESFLLSVPGGLAGLVFGIALIRLLTLEPTVGAYLSGSFTPDLLLRAFLLALSVGAAGAVYPALQAANRSPIEALNYE